MTFCVCKLQILRLTYTNSGNAIFALASNAVHVLWKWSPNEHNFNGKAWWYLIFSKPLNSLELQFIPLIIWKFLITLTTNFLFLQAMTKVAPHLVQPASGTLMMNDITDAKSKDGVHCFALSKNDHYLMSASGGMISLFNMIILKVMPRIL